MDSFLGNFQEAIFTMNPETTQMEMLFCSTVVGLPFLIPPMLLTGELFTAWNSCSQVDTKDILFICGGAFLDLEKTISERRQDSSIVFGARVRANMRAGGLTNAAVTSSLLESALRHW
ncbi:uncharacterized protein LOC131221009 [Magnolia sinica]|uniref:uncharacterized protein LOC131221009 n=1 Tax=Magnolia sinica TaxID=86752 RepID=UPI00265A7DE5|nr:uncharacterized protein LOC131221009 [Magnolia sinica]